MLYTNLKHIETAEEYAGIISENENVVVICGRMGVMSIQVYSLAEELEFDFPNVMFYDMEYDNPESEVIQNLAELPDFKSLPFVVYYKNGQVVNASSGIQTKVQMAANLEKEFTTAVHV